MPEDPKSSPYSPEAGSRKTTLEIGPDGTIRMAYSDELWKFAEKIGGDMRATCRASNVEWEKMHCPRVGCEIYGWTIRAAHDKDLAIRHVWAGLINSTLECSRDPNHEIAVYSERAVAVEIEIRFFHELLPPAKTEGT